MGYLLHLMWIEINMSFDLKKITFYERVTFFLIQIYNIESLSHFFKEKA